jgi:alkylation response protein AidB-like acyl-CoA dehydrogenase
MLLDDVLIVARHLRVDGDLAIDCSDIRQEIGRLRVEASVARAVVDDHVERVLDGEEAQGDAAVAKITFTETYHDIAVWGVSLAATGALGGGDHAVEALSRLQDSWLWSRAYTVSAGSSEMMRNILAKRCLKLPSLSR